MSEGLDGLKEALHLLGLGDYEAVLDLIESQTRPPGSIIASVELLARGLLAERQGHTLLADEYLDRVVAAGVPEPTVLRETGRYMKRRCRWDDAYDCFVVLHTFSERFLDEFLDELPSRELARYAPWGVTRLMKRRRPGFWFLPPFKKALTDWLGAEEAATVFAPMAGLAPGWRVARVHVQSLREYAEHHALVYRELARPREVVLPPVPVAGSQRPEITTRTRTIFFCALPDAVVSSKSNLLLVGDRALLDFQTDELEKVPIELDVDPIVFGEWRDTVTVLVDGRAVVAPALEHAFALTGVNSYNFGHWMIEFLPRVLMCLDLPAFHSIPILVDEQMPPQNREALELFAGADHPVVSLKPGEAVRVRELWTCAMPAYVPVAPRHGVVPPPDLETPDAEFFARLIRRVHPILETLTERGGPRCIYLTRQDTQHRRLVNRPEVERWFKDRGFEVFDFTALCLRDQLRLVRGADVIVGPDGSSLYATLFAREGTRVGELTNAYADDNEFLAAISHRLGNHLSILCGENVNENSDYRQRSDYRIPVEALPAFLIQLLGSPDLTDA